MASSLTALRPTAFPGLLALWLILDPASVSGSDWKLSVEDRLDTRLVFTDNRRLDQSNASDTVIDLRPGVSLSRAGARMRVDLDYDLAIAQSLSGDQGARLSNLLNATLASELYENTWFLDASAGANLISVNGLSSLGSDGINDDQNSTQAYSFSVSPHSRHHLGKYLDLVSRLNIDYVDAQDGAVAQSGAYDFLLTLQSGRYFTRLPWSLSFRESQVERQERTDENRSLIGQVNYRIDRRWGVYTRLGVESNDVQTSRSDTEGLIWSLGGTWTPNPRTRVDASLGQRYFGNDLSFSLSHQTRRTRLVGSYTRTVSNVRRLIQEALVGTVLLDGQPVLDVDGEPLQVQVLLPQLIDEDFVQDSLSLVGTVGGKRSSASLQASWSSRSYEVSADEEDSFGLTASVSRAVTPLTSATASLSWQQTESDSGADRSTYLAALGLSRRVGRTSSVSFNISHRQQDDANGQPFDENRVSAGFTTQLW